MKLNKNRKMIVPKMASEVMGSVDRQTKVRAEINTCKHAKCAGDLL